MRARISITTALGALLMTLAWASQADIYKYVDKDGHTTLTDQWRPGAVKVYSSSRPNTTSPAPSRSSRKASANPTPASFPRVDTKTQNKRDMLRKDILREEMDHESRLLGELKEQLRGKKAGQDSARLNEAIRHHQNNIDMLKREIARIK